MRTSLAIPFIKARTGNCQVNISSQDIAINANIKEKSINLIDLITNFENRNSK